MSQLNFTMDIIVNFLLDPLNISLKQSDNTLLVFLWFPAIKWSLWKQKSGYWNNTMSPTKTDRHDITEILLKVALNIIDLIKPIEHWHTNVKGKQIDDEYRFEPTNSILVLHSVIPISTFLFSETPFNGWKSQEHQQSIVYPWHSCVNVRLV
jgi:hypothetical protein